MAQQPGARNPQDRIHQDGRPEIDASADVDADASGPSLKGTHELRSGDSSGVKVERCGVGISEDSGSHHSSGSAGVLRSEAGKQLSHAVKDVDIVAPPPCHDELQRCWTLPECILIGILGFLLVRALRR